MTKFYLASVVQCAVTGTPGNVKQSFFGDLESAKAYAEAHGDFEDAKEYYDDFAWHDEGVLTYYSKKGAETSDFYNYAQINEVSMEELSNGAKEIELDGI